MKNKALVVAATALTSLMLIAQTPPAQAEVLPSLPPAETHTDVSTLNLIPISAETEVSVVETAGRQENPSFSPELAARQVDCGGRIDWYRIINSWTGKTWCFADAGEYRWGGSIYADTLCPGNNKGQVLWTYKPGPFSDSFKWSIVRDGHGNHNQCYTFDKRVYIDAVRIS